MLGGREQGLKRNEMCEIQPYGNTNVEGTSTATSNLEELVDRLEKLTDSSDVESCLSEIQAVVSRTDVPSSVSGSIDKLLKCAMNHHISGDSSTGTAASALYTDILLHVILHHQAYTEQCIHALIKAFLTTPTESADGTTDTDPSKVHTFVHSVLKGVMSSSLFNTSVVMTALSKYFPYMSRDVESQRCYVGNMLELSGYARPLSDRVVKVIVDKMLILDVHAPRDEVVDVEDDDDISDEDDNVSDDDNNIASDVDSSDGDSASEGKTGASDNGSAKQSDSPPEVDVDSKMKHEMAHKLDILMEVMFAHIRSAAESSEGVGAVYDTFYAAFEQIVLKTRASCHVQYLMYYILSLSEDLTEKFLSSLWREATGHGTPAGAGPAAGGSGGTLHVVRHYCVGYMSSLLARANYITLQVVMQYVGMWCRWLHEYSTSRHSLTHPLPPAKPPHQSPAATDHSPVTAAGGSVKSHSLYYSVCQAVFYVVTFRHREFASLEQQDGATATPNGIQFLQGLNLHGIIHSPLNPLKFCNPQIVDTFASVMRLYEVVYCYPVIEENKRKVLAAAGTAGKAGRHRNKAHKQHIDTFLPFEPYLLKKSSTYVSHLYREYDSTLLTTARRRNHSSGDDGEGGGEGGVGWSSKRRRRVKAASISDSHVAAPSPQDLLLQSLPPH